MLLGWEVNCSAYTEEDFATDRVPIWELEPLCGGERGGAEPERRRNPDPAAQEGVFGSALTAERPRSELGISSVTLDRGYGASARKSG